MRGQYFWNSVKKRIYKNCKPGNSTWRIFNTKMPSFGDSVLIIKNADEFFNRVKDALLANNIGYSRDFVSYYGFNNVDHLKQIQKDNLRIAFWKRQKYEYQQEYRLVAHTEVDDYLCVEIGDISDITEIMKTKQLLNTYLEVTFSVKPME